MCISSPSCRACSCLLGKVLAAHGANHGDSLVPLGRAFDGLRAELDAHLAKEEMVLFPMIKGMEAAQQAGRRAPAAHCGSVNNPIRVMVHEHDNAGRALESMRQATGDYALPPDACNTYRALFGGLRGNGGGPAPAHSPGKQHPVPARGCVGSVRSSDLDCR